MIKNRYLIGGVCKMFTTLRQCVYAKPANVITDLSSKLVEK